MSGCQHRCPGKTWQKRRLTCVKRCKGTCQHLTVITARRQSESRTSNPTSIGSTRSTQRSASRPKNVDDSLLSGDDLLGANDDSLLGGSGGSDDLLGTSDDLLGGGDDLLDSKTSLGGPAESDDPLSDLGPKEPIKKKPGAKKKDPHEDLWTENCYPSAETCRKCHPPNMSSGGQADTPMPRCLPCSTGLIKR